MATDPKQPYRFEIINEDQSVTEGGAESKGLAIDHLIHCLQHSVTIEKCKKKTQAERDAVTKPAIRCFYLGSGDSMRREITLD